MTGRCSATCEFDDQVGRMTARWCGCCDRTLERARPMTGPKTSGRIPNCPWRILLPNTPAESTDFRVWFPLVVLMRLAKCVFLQPKFRGAPLIFPAGPAGFFLSRPRGPVRGRESDPVRGPPPITRRATPTFTLPSRRPGPGPRA